MEDTLADIGRVRVIIGMVLATLFMIGVGVGIFLFALLIWWLTNRYKGFAAYEGVAGVADMARQTL